MEVIMNKSIRLSTILQVQSPAAVDSAWKLQPGEAVSLERSKGKQLRCSAGQLWVTFEHDKDDIILGADQSLDIDENGRVVISALESGSASFKVA
jgi:hypothetical protein